MCCRERFWKMYSFPSSIWRCHIQHQLSLCPFQLTASEVKNLVQLVQAHYTPQALARLARIVLTAHSHRDWSSKQPAQALDLHDRLARKWRRRWQKPHSLTYLSRSGAPRRFSHAGRLQTLQPVRMQVYGDIDAARNARSADRGYFTSPTVLSLPCILSDRSPSSPALPVRYIICVEGATRTKKEASRCSAFSLLPFWHYP